MSDKKTPNAGKGPTRTQGIGATEQRANPGRPPGKPIQYPDTVGRTK